MERCFIATEKSDFFKALKKYSQLAKGQKKFINNFFKEKNIEANLYLIKGDGLVNRPFPQNDIGNIRLSIVPTENDIKKFGKILCKPNELELCAFRKSSNISTEFAQKCINEQIVINLFKPRIADYFSSLGFGIYGCTNERFFYNDKLYLKVASESLKKDDIPDGFHEIKLSKYYLTKEQIILK